MLTDDERGFGFVRITTGDELSRRAKFAFIMWVGPAVSALKRAKMGTDKSVIKQVIQVGAASAATSPAGSPS